MLGKLYENFGISDRTDFRKLAATDYPILSDLYALIETEYKGYDKTKYQLYPPELLQEILLYFAAGLRFTPLKSRQMQDLCLLFGHFPCLPSF